MSRFILRTLLVFFVVVGMATSAMAFQVVNRSAEMTANSKCDRAGTVQMTFELSDWTTITAWLASHPYAEIRIALNGVDTPAGAALPKVCNGISGTATANGVPHSGSLVKLTTTSGAGQDISAFWAAVDADIYVWAASGDQIIHVYITKLAPNVTFGIGNDPWFKIGLYPEASAPTDPTTICADVTDFSGFAKLTISNESLPSGLSFTGDNEIGHFLGVVFESDACGCKGDPSCLNVPPCTSKKIPACSVESQGSCPEWTQCVTVAGGWPSTNEVVEIEVRTNGVKQGETTQAGIFLRHVALTNTAGTAVSGVTDQKYYDAAGNEVTPANCGWKAVSYKAKVPAANLAAAGTLKYCINYEIKPDAVVMGSTVHFWLNATTVPCGNLFNLNFDSQVTIVPCGSGCIYFQYVLQQNSPWFTGIAITNLSTSPDFTNSKATFTLTDSAGNQFEWVKTPVETVVFAFGLDTELANFKAKGAVATPVKGAAWLKVETNYEVDGYEYLTNGSYSSSVLSRFCDVVCTK